MKTYKELNKVQEELKIEMVHNLKTPPQEGFRVFYIYSSSGITDIINPVASPKSPPLIIFPFSSNVK